MQTISIFYSIEFEGKLAKPPIKEKSKPLKTPSFKDMAIDALTYKGENYENELQFLDAFSYIAKDRITRKDKYTGNFTRNLFNELKSENGEEYLVEVYLYRGEVRALRVVDATGNSETIFGDDWIDFSESENNLLDPFMTKTASQIKLENPTKLFFAVPEFAGKALRASGKATFGGEYNISHETRDSIEKFNKERPGSDSKFDKSYKEIRDRIEGRSGWINV